MISIRFLFVFTLINLFSFALIAQDKIRVALLSPDPYKSTNLEIKAALDFLKGNEREIESSYLSFEEVLQNNKILTAYDVVWIHENDTAFTENPDIDKISGPVLEYVKEGGNLLLTLEAFRLINDFGLEETAVQLRKKEVKDEGYGRKLGLHAFRSHPLFEGLHGGAYIYKPIFDMEVRQLGYFDDSLPESGKVAAVDWDYIFLRENKKLVLEYEYGKGKALAIGAYTYFAAPNYNHKHLKKFASNAIFYLAGKFQEQTAHYWVYGQDSVRRKSFPLPPVLYNLPRPWPKDTASLVLSSQYATDNYWDVATQRILVMGEEKGGIKEIWAHPFMAFRDYEVGLKFSYEDTVRWLNDRRPKIEIRPGAITRTYKFKRAYLTEVITAAMHKPAGIAHYEYRGVYPAEVFIRFNSNMRMMWPYSEHAGGDLLCDWDEVQNLFVIRDSLFDLSAILGTDHNGFSGGFREDVPDSLGKYFNFKKDSLKMVQAWMHTGLEMNQDFNVFFSASNEGLEITQDDYIELIKYPDSTYIQTENHYKHLIENSLTIHTPDTQFNEGYLWALVATDQFFVHTPGLGKSLTAGYATSDKGWWGGHEISGRPGYGWYFGRDAIWSAFALLDYGDFEKVKDILINFQRYQDLNGKVYHELSTSGFVHYDAADATPLYLILMGRYLEHSGDPEFIQQSWPSIQMALEYCFSTDTDADHLIENTDVGHGWVEGGHLFGSHTSLHLASLWAEALHQSSLMAHALEKEDLAENYEFEAELVKEIINTKFWNEEQEYLYQGLLKDGNFLEEFTIMPCIPIYFGQLDSAKIYPQLNAYAANAFSSDWGVRIVSAESPRFNPKGYHTGSVWPLFTGWTALAEYKAGKPVQGFTHIMNNNLVYQNWGMGYVEEVLNGELYRPSGVCAHQCWSETMVLQPVVEGLIGFKPDALDESFTLAPSFPYHWGDVKIKNLKLANKRVDFEMMKNQGAAIYTFKPEFNNPVNVNFQPLFPHGTTIGQVMLGEKKISPKIKTLKEGVRLIIDFELTADTRIAIAITGGVGVLPLAPDPRPGERSEGFRIIDDFLTGNEYHIILEGPSGSRQSFKVLNGFDRIDHIQNAHHIRKEGNIHEIAVEFEDAGKPYVQKEVIISIK